LHCSTCSRNHILRLNLYMWKQKTREKKNQSTDPIRSERKIWITTILLELSYAKTAPSIASPNVVLIARRHPTTYSPPPVTSILLRNKKTSLRNTLYLCSLSLSLSLSVLSPTLLFPAFPLAKVPSQIRDCKWNLSPRLVLESGLLADYMNVMQIKIKAETRASQVSKHQQR